MDSYEMLKNVASVAAVVGAAVMYALLFVAMARSRWPKFDGGLHGRTRSERSDQAR